MKQRIKVAVKNTISNIPNVSIFELSVLMGIGAVLDSIQPLTYLYLLIRTYCLILAIDLIKNIYKTR